MDSPPKYLQDLLPRHFQVVTFFLFPVLFPRAFITTFMFRTHSKLSLFPMFQSKTWRLSTFCFLFSLETKSFLLVWTLIFFEWVKYFKKYLTCDNWHLCNEKYENLTIWLNTKVERKSNSFCLSLLPHGPACYPPKQSLSEVPVVSCLFVCFLERIDKRW